MSFEGPQTAPIKKKEQIITPDSFENLTLPENGDLKKKIEDNKDRIDKRADDLANKKVTDLQKSEIEKALEEIDRIEAEISNSDLDESLRSKILLNIKRSKEVYGEDLAELDEYEKMKKEAIRASLAKSLRNKVDFITEKEKDILSISNSIEKVEGLDEFIGLQPQIVKLLSASSEKSVKGKEMLEFILSSNSLSKEKGSLYSLGDNETYLPYESEKGGADGGDGWLKEKRGNIEEGVVFDTTGHGFETSFQKVFLKKGFELLSKIPKAQREEAEIKLDSMLASLFRVGGGTTASIVRGTVEKIAEEGSREIVSKKFRFTMSGDSVAVVYDPVANEIYRPILNENKESILMGLSSGKELKNNSADKFKGGFIYGYGFRSQIKPTEGEFDISPKAEVVLASDGLSDERNVLPGGMDIESIMRKFIENKKSPEYKDGFAKYLKSVFSDFRNELADDVTIIELGR